MDIITSINGNSKKLPYTSSVVKEERIRLGLSQIDFARKIGIGLKTLRKIEQGDLNISFQKLNYVLNCIGLELSPSEIVASPIRREETRLLKKDVIETLEKALPVLKRRFEVNNMYLFGSYARGKATKSSDVDVLINTGRALKFEEEEEIKLILESLLKGVDVDLTIERNLISEFRDEIMENRIEIKERV